MADTPKPQAPDQDTRLDDQEYNPALEPSSSKAWINLLEESEKAFDKWQDHCDNIDKRYANLERLAQMNREKEFQMFWANCEVLKPAIYARAPVPVVVPKFKDRRPVYQASSEVMERVCTVAFDLTRINDIMLLIRDDLALIGRGVAWCRYEEGGTDSEYETERVCIEFKNRRDFLHSISRTWEEVTWVAAASYLTRREARERFKPTSGDAYQEAEYRVDKDAKTIGGADKRERAKFWEIWSKKDKRVVWVAKGVDVILDEADPHLDLQNYFPCPRPAYGAVQRGSLVPVPDVLQYKDQLEEINTLTGRIHALADALEAKGFYPAGGAELGDAIQAAIKTKTPGRMLVPISNWAAFGGSKEVIIWLPIDMIAQCVTGLVALRKQVIDDIYQVMGLSDIMRGATDPRETLGAQNLKSEFGSSRIRDKQQEMVRVARDLVEIVSEIVTEKFSPVTIIEMSQTQLPTMQMVANQIGQVQRQMQIQVQQAQQLMQSPQAQQMAQGKPEIAQQALQKFQDMQQQGMDTIAKLKDKPTIEQVLQFLKNNRAKSFVLDIETDSTIMANENAEKQARTEFVGVLGQLLPQLSQMITALPQTAAFCGELLKFATAPFKAGRSLDGAIDELVAMMQQKGDQPQPDDPATQQTKAAVQIEQMKLQQAKDQSQAEMQLKAQELQMRDSHEKLKIQNARDMKMMEIQSRTGDTAEKQQRLNLQMINDREKHQQSMIESQNDIELARQKNDMAMRTQAVKSDAAARAQMYKAQQPPKPLGGGM